MLFFSIIELIVAALLLVAGLAVYYGKTEWIHDYHQSRVKDKKAYGKAMGKALLGLSLPFLLGAMAAFFFPSFAVLLLIAGILLALFPLFYVQKKYNGGVF